MDSGMMAQRFAVILTAVLAIQSGFTIVAPKACAASLASLFAPKPELWDRWTAHDANATESVNHEPWTDFLARYRSVGDDGVARIAYELVSADARSELENYVESLSSITISSYARPEQFAYWVNLYNALTIRVVLDAYPVESIRDIDLSKGIFASGPWDAELISVENVAITLNDIEHRILRPIWQDPRIHYVVNCASIGCPNVAATAYSATTMDAMLESAARSFVNSPRGVSVEGDGLTVSQIYEWYDEDFGSSEMGILAHLRLYAAPNLTAALAGITEIESYEYDWSLNDAR